MHLEQKLVEAESRALRYADNLDYSGADPYDGLASPIGKRLPNRRLRQVWVQAHKRTGERMRNFTKVPPIRMTKALALFIHGTSIVHRNYAANELTKQLLDEKGSGPWGYEFDVQTRWAHYPAFSPNVIATVFTLRALNSVNRSMSISTEVHNWLLSLVHNDGYFRYTASSDRLIHNGNLLAAESLARVGGPADVVQRAISSSVSAQNEDGSWSYGEGQGLKWIDNFHTIYNLEALLYLREFGYDVGAAPERGYQYWIEHCLTEGGLPVYYANDRQVSKDIHNIATTVGFLARAIGLKWTAPDPTPSLHLLLSKQNQEGGFSNKPDQPAFMRWNQAHAYYAITRWMELRQLQPE